MDGVADRGLLEGASIRRIAAELGLRPTKQRGQNFVTDPNTVRRIVSMAGVGPDDVVLEIGPGLGSLTLGLLEAGCFVTAVEIDELLASRLMETVATRLPGAQERLRVVTADALDVKELPGPPPSALVANLPYNVSVPVLIHLLATQPSWRTGLVMVQLEVADRLAAEPGGKIYGVPSAKVAWFAEASRIGTVPPKVFWPVPNVDSGLVRLIRHDTTADEGLRLATFKVIDAAFSQRRKMLRAALGGLFGSSAKAQAVLERAGVNPSARGETLDINHFKAVGKELLRLEQEGRDG